MQEAEANSNLNNFITPFSIKYIQLWGFKTFPNKTILRFSKGINIIVGPNGCGKSNIIDALRWVLGEQSPGMLRAKSMDELIYVGEKIKTGFAEVQLSLEGNIFNLFSDIYPLDNIQKNSIGEIVISRRLYTSGDSEYRINGRECRLKDIQYLFMDTGAGTKAYSIIDQGHINRFIDMTPKERKLLIEEAAGVVKYKLKREETLKRIEETKINIETIEKILLEIKSQKDSLDKQLEKTREYISLRKEEEDLKKSILINRYLELNKILESYIDKENEYKSIIISEDAKKNILLNNINDIEIKIVNLENNYKSIDNNIINLENEYKIISDEVFEMEKNIIEKKSKEKNIENTLLDFSNREKGLQKRKIQLKEEDDLLGEKIRDNTIKIQELEMGVNESENFCSNIKSEISVLKNELVDIFSKIAKNETEFNSLENELKRLKLQREKIVKEADELEMDISQNKGDLNNFHEKISLLTESKDQINEKINILNPKKDSIELELSKNIFLIKEKEKRYSEINARYNVLENLYKNMQGINKSNQIIINTFKGHKGLFFENLSVEKGYEGIFDIILGDILGSVLVENTENLRQILSYVKEKGLEGVRIICPAFLSETEVKKDSFGELREKINSESGISLILDEIIGNWEIKNDLDGVLPPKNREKRFFLVDNMVITPYGEIIIGKKDLKDGLIWRKNEIDRLFKEKESLHNEINILKNIEIKLRKDSNEINSQIMSLQKKWDNLIREIDSLKSKIDIIKVKIEAKKERLTYLNFDLDNINEEFEMKNSNLTNLSNIIEDIKREKVIYEEKIKGRECALKNQEDVLKRRKNALENTKIELERHKTQKNVITKEISEIEKRLGNIIFEREKFINELDAIKDNLKKIRDKYDEILIRKDEKNKELENYKNLMRNTKDEIDKLRGELVLKNKELKETQGKRAEIEGKIANLNIQKAKLEQELSLIQDNLFKNFSLNFDTPINYINTDNFNTKHAEKRLKEINDRINEIGPVNLAAEEEFNRLEERFDFLNNQKNDLNNSLINLNEAISSIDNTCQRRFRETLDLINLKLKETFFSLFDGGSAHLVWEKDEGVDFMVKIPGKKLHHLNMLSGGEKALCAISFIFSLFLIKPSPFCILDEADAPLDEANTDRFCRLVKQIATKTQVLIITHNQLVMDIADVLHGVTMEEKGISKIVAVDLVKNMFNNNANKFITEQKPYEN